MPRIAAEMLSRLLATCAGAAIAVGLYGALGSGIAPSLLRPIQPNAGAVGASLPVLSAPVVDSTPVRLVIRAIGVDARIESRGLDPDRNLATPNDYRDVAWYNLGPRPGEPGNAVMNGHVNWWTGDAVFTHLSRLRAGDLVEIVRADRTTVTFQVTSTRTVDPGARIAALFAPGDRSTITLITCSGIWNPLTRTDSRRLLVSASRV